jgi:ribosomal-protein-alanine N-acetyltransferase
MKIRKAKEEDRSEILRIMEFWNMHHIPSEEMSELDISCFFVAEENGKIVGASGYKMISPTEGKTTLLGVDPITKGKGIGRALQHIRMEKMYELGAETVTTNADRVETIAWYIKNFGYKPIGYLDKVHSFGDPAIPHWTTLKTDLKKYFNEK